MDTSSPSSRGSYAELDLILRGLHGPFGTGLLRHHWDLVTLSEVVCMNCLGRRGFSRGSYFDVKDGEKASFGTQKPI